MSLVAIRETLHRMTEMIFWFVATIRRQGRAFSAFGMGDSLF